MGQDQELYIMLYNAYHTTLPIWLVGTELKKNHPLKKKKIVPNVANRATEFYLAF